VFENASLGDQLGVISLEALTIANGKRMRL